MADEQGVYRFNVAEARTLSKKMQGSIEVYMNALQLMKMSMSNLQNEWNGTFGTEFINNLTGFIQRQERIEKPRILTWKKKLDTQINEQVALSSRSAGS